MVRSNNVNVSFQFDRGTGYTWFRLLDAPKVLPIHFGLNAVVGCGGGSSLAAGTFKKEGGPTSKEGPRTISVALSSPISTQSGANRGGEAVKY